ncbi:MAG: hypothetical protein ACK4L8_08705 [Nitrincola lacisaponensis]|uniref:DUF4376 domain-containing protein n=1 Tax=Nitrincola lacisaponensis TaxID=267850 RepID=UPI003918C9DE
MKKIWNYCSITGEKLGFGIADESPLEPGEYLVPANATLIEPPETDQNQAAVFNGNEWHVITDYRGHIYWLEDGSKHEISELGIEPPADALSEPPPPPIADFAAARIADITTARKVSEEHGVTIYGIRYAGDQSNRMALNEALVFAAEAELSHFARWKDSDNQYHLNHPVQDVRQALFAIGQRRGELIDIEGQLVEQINVALLAGDRELIESVAWPE